MLTDMKNIHEYHLKLGKLSCASCVRTIETAARSVTGVTSANVNFAARMATINTSGSIKSVIQAIEQSGYTAELQDHEHDSGHQHETIAVRSLFLQAGLAAGAGLALMILPHWPGFPTIDSGYGQKIWLGLGVLSLVILYFSASDIYRGALKSWQRRSANMDTLIAMGTGVAWLFSMLVTLFPEQLTLEDHAVYFDSALMIIAFIKFGAALEMRTRGKTRETIQSLIALRPRSARIVRGGQEETIAIEDIERGDVLRIRPGDRIPVDGLITEGFSSIDQSMLTGEPIPVDKTVHDKVTAGTLNKTGTFLMRATAVGNETMLARIVEMVNRAQNSKPDLARLADVISSYFVPAVLAIAVIAAVVWLIVGPEPRLAYVAIVTASVLLIACPCALGLASPLAVMAGVGKAAEYGILIRNGDALQKTMHVTTVVFDKTGTITEGKHKFLKYLLYPLTMKVTFCFMPPASNKVQNIRWLMPLWVRPKHMISNYIPRKILLPILVTELAPTCN